ncbi:MAG: hypothetical protein LBL58_13920 [Tannerellaceae bacterium]|jgi:hypothetical protein|nr:hypothetical protein [Tannerellaceae bacterium]
MKKTFKKKIEIEFWFEYTDEVENLTEDERWELENQAIYHIAGMRKECYTSGELCESIDGKEFYGWWEYRVINN